MNGDDRQRFAGRIALVTGAGGEVGRELVARLISEGASVCAVDHDVAALDRLRQSLPIQAALRVEAADVAREEEVERSVAGAVAAFGGLNLLFNNAGVEGGAGGGWRLLTETTVEDFDRVFEVNVTGVFLNMKHGGRAIAASGGGAIVNLSSVAGLRPPAGQLPYAASKTAVIGMTATAARELGGAGVRVNCVCPGPLEGRMMEQIASGMAARRPGGEPPGLRDAMIPLRRWGRPVEAAALALFLASDEAGFVTGGAFPLDGGLGA